MKAVKILSRFGSSLLRIPASFRNGQSRSSPSRAWWAISYSTLHQRQTLR